MRLALIVAMKTKTLTVPELMFIIGTRAALAAGVALLASRKMNDTARKAAAAALIGIGGLTTIPAAKVAFGRRSLLSRLGFAR